MEINVNNSWYDWTKLLPAWDTKRISEGGLPVDFLKGEIAKRINAAAMNGERHVSFRLPSMPSEIPAELISLGYSISAVPVTCGSEYTISW